MRSIIKGTLFALTLFALGACQVNHDILTIKGKTMGTTYQIKWIADGKNLTHEKEIKSAVDSVLVEVNQTMSTYLEDSELSRLNQAKAHKKIKLSQELFMVLEHALTVARITKGAFDPTIGPLVNLWGFGPLRVIKKIPSDKEINKAKKSIGYQNLLLLPKTREVVKTRHDMYIDLSASAKGHGVDRVAQLLEMKGINAYLVEIGGEMRSKGSKLTGPWLIAIESPTPGERSIQKVLKLSDSAIATSGDYRNFFIKDGQRYSHTIDRTSGRPIKNLMTSVSVIDSKSCMNADAWATAITALGPEKGLEVAKAQGIMTYIMYYPSKRQNSPFEVQWTKGFDQLFAN